MSNREQFLWVEKYRPRTIDDCVLPEALKATFKEHIAKGEIPNMILAGTAGVGKTTVARAMCEELGCDYLMINASEDSGINVLRDKIRNFASTVSLSGGTKVVILDEADYLQAGSTQPALRGFIEEFASNCRFILTCNFKNRIIEPLHSRCTIIEFTIPKEDKPAMLAAFMKRIRHILTEENVEFNKDAVARLLMKHYPDYRRVLNELQRYSASGKVDEGVLIDLTEDNLALLCKHLKNKDWSEMRKWVAHNGDNDPSRLIRMIYDHASKYIEAGEIPKLVLILADYQFKVPFVVDQELNMVAMLTEVMINVQFKE
jgi:DNA polymerase III delta prime subunit